MGIAQASGVHGAKNGHSCPLMRSFAPKKRMWASNMRFICSVTPFTSFNDLGEVYHIDPECVKHG